MVVGCRKRNVGRFVEETLRNEQQRRANGIVSSGWETILGESEEDLRLLAPSKKSILEETILGESEEDLRLLAPSKKSILEVQAGRVDDPMIRQLSYVSGSRVNGEWWAACKVRAKLFMDETLNSVGEVSNEFSTFNYYQDDESLKIHDRTSEEEEINLLDAHGLMEEVNVDELLNPMNAPHTDQLIDDDEETDHNEFLDSDEELFDSDSSSDS
ncbi:hypothetical protein G2W53_004236 [Senna tora]|uniref:Uncharacterized protein n=1 Tax=Senna tora TaxID=362788 RepID=A0A834XCI8_9FABA|nr:hypothetical protein G2W53_004236 [Senna tora]